MDPLILGQLLPHSGHLFDGPKVNFKICRPVTENTTAQLNVAFVRAEFLSGPSIVGLFCLYSRSLLSGPSKAPTPTPLQCPLCPPPLPPPLCPPPSWAKLEGGVRGEQGIDELHFK